MGAHLPKDCYLMTGKGSTFIGPCGFIDNWLICTEVLSSLCKCLRALKYRKENRGE